MKFYRIFMDSSKLFFINVFLYIIFMELYVFFLLVEQRLNTTLPFLSVFFMGFVSFIAIAIWMQVARVWYQKIKSPKRLFIRAIISEIPFILMLLIFWMIMGFTDFYKPMEFALIVFSFYMVFFPVIMFVSKGHSAPSELI